LIFKETITFLYTHAKAAADFMFSDLVPAPRHLTLERQLNKSVLIGWNPTDQYGNHQIESYHVYVDGNLKVTVKAAERTRALVEGVDCNRVSIPFLSQLISDAYFYAHSIFKATSGERS
jgi:hypothetical protein